MHCTNREKTRFTDLNVSKLIIFYSHVEVLVGARKRVVLNVAHTRKPIVIENYEFSDFYDPIDNNHTIGSIMCVPILHSVCTVSCFVYECCFLYVRCL